MYMDERLGRRGTETQGVRCREGEAGHNAPLDGITSGTLRSILVSTELQRLAEIAVKDPTYVFTSIAHKMGLDFLYEAYLRTRKDGAPGVSGKTAKDYKKNLEGNLENLFLRLRSGSYIAPPVRRVWIEKSGGKKKRPLGIPEFEDKIVQRAVCMLLGAIFEKDFYDFSHGFREGRSPHDAIRGIREYCRTMGINWILDADVSGFPAIAPCIALPLASMQSFDNIDHKLLMQFVKQRVNDGGIIRLLGRWLNAGVMDNGGISYSDRTYTMEDAALGALSIFFMQSPTFLEFQRTMKLQNGRANARTLFRMSNIPSDAQIRNLMDGVLPSCLFSLYDYIIEVLYKYGFLDQYRSINGTLLLPIDGTEYFSSKAISSANCTVKERSKGNYTFSHTVVTPNHCCTRKQQDFSVAA